MKIKIDTKDLKVILSNEGYTIRETSEYYIYKYEHPLGIGSYEFIEAKEFINRIQIFHNGEAVPPYLTGMMMQMMGWEEFSKATLAMQKSMAMSDCMSVGEKTEVMQRCYLLSFAIISKFYPIYEGMAVEVIRVKEPVKEIFDSSAGSGGFFS